MALVTCRMCKRVFINSPEEETTCAECMAKLQELYPIVRNFLRDNEKTSFTAYDISKMLNIDIRNIEGLVALGLIALAGSQSNAERNSSTPRNEASASKRHRSASERGKKFHQ